MSTHTDPEHDEHADAPVDDAHDEHAEDNEAHEASETEKLQKAVELIAKVAKEGEKSGLAVDSIAEAAYILRTSFLTAPFRMAWNILPAFAQREFAAAEQTGFGEFLMRYLPFLNLRNYFVPGLMASAFAKAGILEFKMNDEEEAKMKSELGEQPSEAARLAFQAKVEEEVVKGIITPYEGASKIVTGPVGKVVTMVEPELAPVIGVAKAGEAIEGARDSYLAQVRERVHALELSALQAKEAAEQAKTVVPDTRVQEHNAVASADPEAHIPPLPAANNSDHLNQSAAA